TQSSDNHSAPVRVWAGGQAIGVRIQSNRVTVVGYERAAGVSPAAAARIQPGDVIEKIGSHPVSTIRDVRRWVNLSPVPLTLTIRHGQLRRIVTLRPLVESDGTRRLGLYVRDTTSGIGTLTFYDPVHHRFGALGHVITDVETGMPVEGTGVLYDAEVTGVVRGQPGRPGEKRGRMDVQRGQLGDVWRNTEFGVFGRIHRNPHSALFKGPLVVASPAQVHVGPAKMLTVLHGRRVDAFDVVIESVAHQDTPSPKSLVIRVTDPRLLAETGGIVQGMSGSPVIQDGRLAAAVTHVFISDVTRGYGVYAAWMMQQAQASPGAGVGKRKAVRAAWARQATAARSATGS
ncbi:MAG: SpoIVB peptidase, partial [Alicyclobacillaceae bacterium]|nr:SpoIVB peptidase [Alicyclobacillaceae bacterium]